MKFVFDTTYTDEEKDFINRYGCEILSEITLSRVAFREKPLRMISYCGTYIAQICEEDALWWAVLGKSRKGGYVFTELYETLQTMAEGL